MPAPEVPRRPRADALTLVAAAVVLGLALAVWWPATNHALVWDDVGLIQKKLSVIRLDWVRMTTTALWADVPNAADLTEFYRPLVVLSFGVDQAVAGGHPGFVHLHSVVWHVLNVALVMGASRRWGPGAMAAAGAWVAVHPLTVEPVAFAAARNDLMAGAGCLVALWAAERGRWGWLAVSTAAAALSKEAALLLPVFLFAQAGARRTSLLKGPLASAAGVAGVVALRAACSVGWPTSAGLSAGAAAEQLAVFLTTSAGWLVWPMPASATVNVHTALPMAPWILSLLAAGLLTAGLVRNAPNERWRLVAAALALLTCAPAVFETGKIAARYGYLPILLLAPAIAEAAAGLFARSVRSLLAVTAVAALAGSMGVRQRLSEWVDEERLFAAAATRTPDALSLTLLAARRRNEGEATEAFRLCAAAIPYANGPETACVPAAKLAWSGSLADSRRQFAELAPAGHACRGIAGVDDQLLWVAARNGAWDLVLPLLEVQTKADGSGRSQAVRAAVRLNDGDWTALMTGAIRHKAGMAAYLDAAYGVALARSTPPPTTPSAARP